MLVAKSKAHGGEDISRELFATPSLHAKSIDNSLECVPVIDKDCCIGTSISVENVYDSAGTGAYV